MLTCFVLQAIKYKQSLATDHRYIDEVVCHGLMFFRNVMAQILTKFMVLAPLKNVKSFAKATAIVSLLRMVGLAPLGPIGAS